MSEHMTVAQNLKAACELHDKNNNIIWIWQQSPPKDTVKIKTNVKIKIKNTTQTLKEDQ